MAGTVALSLAVAALFAMWVGRRRIRREQQRLARERIDAAEDAILMDVKMPGMVGAEATQRLRRGNGPNAHTPIIALTASTSHKKLDRVQRAGLTLHLA